MPMHRARAFYPCDNNKKIIDSCRRSAGEEIKVHAQLKSAFDDMASDFDGGASKPAAAAAATTLYREPCARCRGSGRYHRCTEFGTVCLKCNGAGFHEYKTSSAYRLLQRSKAAAGKADKKVRAAQAWRDANPEASAWIAKYAGTGEGFGYAMHRALEQWGSLTDNQLAAVLKCIESGKVRAIEAEQRAEAAPVIENTALMDAFAKARAAGLKFPRITLGAVVISPAGESSKNAGALYVKEEGQYLGKVMGGKFLRVRECGDEQAQRVADLLADPKAAAKAYGIKTGRCCLCNRELTDPVSIANGIGPVCETNYGF